MREANKRERERREAEKKAAGTRRRRQGPDSESVEADTPPRLHSTPTTVPQLSSVAMAIEAATPP